MKLRKPTFKERVTQIGDTEVIHRTVPIYVTLIFVLVLMAIIFIIGMMIGYGILHSPIDIFKPSTWQHLRELTGSGS